MNFDKDKMMRQVVAYLVDWQKCKNAHRPGEINEPGRSPLSQNTFAYHRWKEYLPGLGAGITYSSTAYQYVKDFHKRETQEFEQAIAEVFQELERLHVITVAAPYDAGGCIAKYGLGLGGTPSHQYEFTSRSARFASLDFEGFMAVLTIPKGYEDLTERVATFVEGLGQYDKNVFLIMPFGADADLAACRKSMTTLLKRRGYNLFRADDREYEDGLWDNISVYMLGCKYAVALFKEVSGVSYNANVGIELGFMKALNKRVLILKDAKLPRLPGDLIHSLYHPVDFSDVASVEKEVGKWFDDLA